MGRLSIVNCVLGLEIWIRGPAYAADPADFLPPEQAFQFSAKVNNADKLLLSWDIADGYYLYRHKFKFVSLSPGIKLGQASFPASLTKHDKFFGDVSIYRGRLAVEIPF